MCQTLMIGYYNANATVTDGFQTYYGADFDLTNFIESLRKDI
jgi:hypothetical protein